MKNGGIYLCPCVVMIIFVGLVLGGCTKPEPTPGPALSTPALSTAAAKPGWEEQWNKVVAEAKREGKVLVYASAPPEMTTFLIKTFKEKYGIDVEFVVGRGAELVEKMARERRAGLYLVDVTIPGWSPYTTVLKPLNITDPIEPLLILPEVKDPSKWLGARLPQMDKAGHAFTYLFSPSVVHVINTDLVKKGEISGIRDFLNPKWKEKIVLSDPTLAGSSVYFYMIVLNDILGREEGRAYMRELSKSIGVITRDFRQYVEWVARGKYAVGIATNVTETVPLMELGAPLAFVDTNEPRMVIPSSGLTNVIKDRPHPNAAQLFINQLFSRETVSEIVRIRKIASNRLDVSTEHVLPILAPRPNDVLLTEELQTQLPEMMRMAKEDFAILYK